MSGYLFGLIFWCVMFCNGKMLIYVDSFVMFDYLLINNKNYFDLVIDIQGSFKILVVQYVDIFIVNKGDCFGLLEK